MTVFRREVERRKDGTVRFNLDKPSLELIESITGQVREKILLFSDPDTTRLTPPAHPDRPDLNDEFNELQADSLLAQRLDDLDILERTGTEDLTLDQLEQWLRAANAVRLVIGTRLDVSEETTYPDEDDPDAGLFWIYEFFALLQYEVLRILSGELPEPPNADS